MTNADLAAVSKYRNDQANKKRADYEAKLDSDLESAITPLTNELVKVNSSIQGNKYANGTADTTIKSNLPKYNPSGNNNKNDNKNDNTDKEEPVDLLQLLKSTIINGDNLNAYNAEYVKQTGNELNSKNYWEDLTKNFQQLADSSGNTEFVKQIEVLLTKLPTYEAPKEDEEKVEVNVIQLAEDAVNSGDFTELDKYIQQETKAQEGSVKFIEAKINALSDIEGQTTDIGLIGKVDAEVDKLKAELETLKKQIRITTDPEGVQAEEAAEVLSNAKSQANDIKAVTGGISQMMGSIARVTDDATASWLNYVGGILSSAGQLIAAIQAVTCANSALSASQTPIIGWMAVGVAVASTIAAFANIPKFQDGGIVGGYSFSGDNVLARVNSGEMILNKLQQRNLFTLLENGSPISKGNNEVSFKIQGKELVGVLRNYNNKISKVL